MEYLFLISFLTLLLYLKNKDNVILPNNYSKEIIKYVNNDVDIINSINKYIF